jgi:cyclopropane fatty-acyl-phospholipid synthase-like methyltransferase
VNKPFSQACANNQGPISVHLSTYLAAASRVLEIGSGTGQHAVYFAEKLPHLHWHTSDLAANHPGINAWIDDYPGDNLHRPVSLDVTQPWPELTVDAVYSANTLHIMAWPMVEALFANIASVLTTPATLVVYGPFKYSGQFTSASNAQFDAFLKMRNPQQGIRDFEAVNELAEGAGFTLKHDHAMPANNQLLVWTSAQER